MKQETTIGKAFEINKDPTIYGTFAEIGAGQETVNFFYKAGLASQTVAKSMSAYDMTVSDEIYGKQNRYVCKERLLTMLEREYSLLKKRLNGRLGGKSRFFAFAVTAAVKVREPLKKNHNQQAHAWMGLRFQAQPGEPFNDIIFHINCGDKNRLEQHSALGLLGLNLIYSAFHCGGDPKKLISSLKENLSLSRIDIQGMSCSGPALKKCPSHLISLELLSESLSSMAFFSKEGQSVFLSDSAFNKYPVLLYGDPIFKKSLNRSLLLKSLSLKTKQVEFISFVSAKGLRDPSPSSLEKFFKGDSLLITSDSSLDSLSQKLALYANLPVVFVVSEDHFTKKMFNLKKGQNLLKFFGSIFEGGGRVAVFSKNRGFSVRTSRLKNPQEQILKDYLVAKKHIVDAAPSV